MDPTDQMLQKLLDDLEQKQQLVRDDIYKSFVNQPELLAISSNNAQVDPNFKTNQNGFSNFTVNLPRPILNAKSLQLLTVNLPQAQSCIPNTSLVWYYYRMKAQTDINGQLFYSEIPIINNLFCIRLLPDYYKKELIQNASKYGFNRTFSSYDDLVEELNKACQNDLAYDNDPAHHFPFIPSCVSFKLNSQNKLEATFNVKTYTPELWEEKIYAVNDLVSFDGNNYICKEPSTEPILPTVEEYWAIYLGPLNYTYLVAGYDDSLIKIQQKLINEISQTYDFDILTGIPGQPYNSDPNAILTTLNTRTGFTWNGRNFMSQNIVYPETYPVSSADILPLFYNRLRPIPPYAAGATEEMLGAVPGYNSYTYSAEGYANLVYSSVISIYTSVIGASSVDTQRNNNLLGVIQMNCGNLGVTFFNNSIDNQLTKIVKDIYSIYIELKTETGEDYVITNNGVVTLTLKLTYQE